MSFSNLHVYVIVVPGGPATLKPNGVCLNAKPLGQVRLDEYFLHAEATAFVGKRSASWVRPGSSGRGCHNDCKNPKSQRKVKRSLRSPQGRTLPGSGSSKAK
ncbi:hypothetical protein [Ensifer sp.]|uniref:hypothetical protein n=1 Tax=Ensifer sp. TaxID=1872086 RepID=UPI002E132001|nr:hypothetical protein [Ensifer sp.]